MSSIFRPSTFIELKPLIQKGYRKAACNYFRPQKITKNQTNVVFSTILATHLLSKKLESNVVFSPVSVHAVLSLLAAGSKGPTQEQLLAFLKTNTTDDLNSLYSQLASSILADGSPNGGPRLSFANGLWLHKTLSLKPSFKQVVDTVYKAACKQADFHKADEVADEVNLWAEKQTNGLIKDVLSPSSITSLTRLIFANAIYFKGTWSQKFNKSKTKKHDFHLLDGNKVKVPFMTSREDQFVREYDDFKVLGLPYQHGQDERRFTMYVFLPDAKNGLQSLVEKMGSTSDFLDRHIPRFAVELERFLMPKFKIEFGFEASSVLNGLGLKLPFTEDCDLTEIADLSVGEEPLYVSSIFQKSYVEVNEEGTEAAAVTMMRCKGASRYAERPKKVDFVADHPFLFVIREDVSGAVLFMGHVVDPRVD